jgi:phosphatidylinositol-bisphosphatase
MPAISLVSDLLRSPDNAKVVLEATLVTASETSQDLQNRRVLAVISHRDDWDLTEEGWYIFPLPNFNFRGYN